MTTFAVLADVHANLEALFAVMADIDAEAPGATIVHCGDVVGYGPQPNEVIDLLRARRAIGVLGNHDARAINHPLEMRFNPDAEAAIVWTKHVLTPASVAWLRELPERLEVGDATLVHGSPRDPLDEYVMEAGAATVSIDALATPLGFHGHTHIPAYWCARDGAAIGLPIGGDAVEALPRSYVNPGSVGQPRDRDPRAAYLLWTPGGDGETSFGTLRWRRIDYEIDRTVAAMEAVKLPQGLRDRLYAGR